MIKIKESKLQLIKKIKLALYMKESAFLKA
jgi:hypothetical protein